MLHLDVTPANSEDFGMDPVEASELQEASRSTNYTEVYGDELSLDELYIVWSSGVVLF